MIHQESIKKLIISVNYYVLLTYNLAYNVMNISIYVNIRYVLKGWEEFDIPLLQEQLHVLCIIRQYIVFQFDFNISVHRSSLISP